MEQYLDKIAKAPAQVKFGVLAGLIVLLTAANWYFVVDDVETQIQSIASQQRTQDGILAEKEELAMNLNLRRKELEDLERRLEAALLELPEEKNLDELLAQLNDIGKKTGLQILAITPKGEAPQGFYASLPVEMAVRGNYQEIALFIQELSNMRRIVNVSQVKLSSPKLANEKVVLESGFVATAFRFLPNTGGNLDPTKNPKKK